MPLTDDFLGSLGTGVTLSMTTADDTPVTVPIHGILDFQPPGRQFRTAMYTPLSGTLAGLEQVIIGSQQSATIQATVVYDAAHKTVMDENAGKNGVAITLTMPDGAVYAGTGGMSIAAAERVTDTKEITDTITLNLAAGWTYTAAGGGT